MKRLAVYAASLSILLASVGGAAPAAAGGTTPSIAPSAAVAEPCLPFVTVKVKGTVHYTRTYFQVAKYTGRTSYAAKPSTEIKHTVGFLAYKVEACRNRTRGWYVRDIHIEWPAGVHLIDLDLSANAGRAFVAPSNGASGWGFMPAPSIFGVGVTSPTLGFVGVQCSKALINDPWPAMSLGLELLPIPGGRILETVVKGAVGAWAENAFSVKAEPGFHCGQPLDATSGPNVFRVRISVDSHGRVAAVRGDTLYYVKHVSEESRCPNLIGSGGTLLTCGWRHATTMTLIPTT